MAYHHYAPVHVSARVANWIVGVGGACAAITGVYSVFFNLPRIVPAALLGMSLLGAIALAIAWPRATRTLTVPAGASRAYLLAGIAAVMSVVSLVAVLVPITAQIGVSVATSLVQAVLATWAVLLWWRAESWQVGSPGVS